ncbi:MAG: 1-deoxy-D-xylulose-5-phosphate reductoisomerase [Clostridiales bacterium]|nr:1-deoxy-D-xylulose-5-phosphate reductoisomerase [Clostridiales bacterium]
MKRAAVFGSTGSIGKQTLSVCREHPDEFSVYALVFGHNIEEGTDQILEFDPAVIGVYDEACAKEIGARFPGRNVVSGSAVNELAALPEVDTVVNGVSGFSGTFPLIKALDAGKTVALANKESVVCAGGLVRAAMQKGGGKILPVDSEQSAVFQALSAGRREDVRSIILTASGGSFRSLPYEELEKVTPEMAMKHPNWSMGRKITIDSSTLFNKGLEVMEAAFLFDASADEIKVLVHPQSIVHSMVEYKDNSIIAQLSVPDMRLAIQYAMTYPERIDCPAKQLDLTMLSGLTFEEPDTVRFPALPMAYEALKAGGSLPVAYNSGNEAAVERFIKGELLFTEIPECVAYAMERIERVDINDMETLLHCDKEARRMAYEFAVKR